MERAIKFYKEMFGWKVTEMGSGYAIFESCDLKYPLAGNQFIMYTFGDT
jgi:predicted enzyme related to lactoylglutathione lyase